MIDHLHSSNGHGFGFGKLILLGEHAVVFGKPALAMAIERGVSVEVSPSSAARIVVQGEDSGSIRLRNALDNITCCFPALPKKLEFQITSDLPSGVGLGSSAAFCVGATRACLSLAGGAVGLDEVLRIADLGERVFHLNPSGLDATCAGHGGLIWFERGRPHIQLEPQPSLRIIVAVADGTRSTGTVVAAVDSLRNQEPGRIEAIFEKIGSITEAGRIAVGNGDWKTLGLLMNRNQRCLKDLGASTCRLDEICEEARRAGAYGAKLTGAGGGGCVIAIADGNEKPVCEAIRNRGVDELFVARPRWKYVL